MGKMLIRDNVVTADDEPTHFPHAHSFALPCIPGDHVLIVPLDNMKARVTRVEITAEEGWIVECRYFHEGEAKTIRCFVDEVVGA